MTSKTFNWYNSTRPQVTKIIKLMYSSKMSWEYILLSFCVKALRRFWWFLGQKVLETGCFCAIFVYSGQLGRQIWLLWLPPPPPLGGELPPPIEGAPSSSWAGLAVSSSFYVKALSFRLWPQHDLETPYWSPEQSYMASSRTATSIYIAARFRVNILY